MSHSLKRLLLIGLAAQCLSMARAKANDFEKQIRELFDQELSTWLSNPVLIQAIREQNRKHQRLSATAIETLDQDWRSQAQVGAGPLVDALLSRDASAYLLARKNATQGLVTEVFVMDNKGLNVAQSDITSDYMQGDEAKWRKTFRQGPGAVFVDEIEFDESTGLFQSQISATVVDPNTGEAIGAVTFGIDVDELG